MLGSGSHLLNAFGDNYILTNHLVGGERQAFCREWLIMIVGIFSPCLVMLINVCFLGSAMVHVGISADCHHDLFGFHV